MSEEFNHYTNSSVLRIGCTKSRSDLWKHRFSRSLKGGKRYTKEQEEEFKWETIIEINQTIGIYTLCVYWHIAHQVNKSQVLGQQVHTCKPCYWPAHREQTFLACFPRMQDATTSTRQDTVFTTTARGHPPPWQVNSPWEGREQGNKRLPFSNAISLGRNRLI